MLFDINNTFAEAEATGNTGTRTVGDVIDLGSEQNRDIGVNSPMYLNVQVDTKITAGAGGTYQVNLVTSANSDLSAGTTLISSDALDSASDIEKGTQILNGALPSAGYKRYLGIQEVVGTANTTAGKIDAFLSRDQRSYTAYEDAQN